MEEIHSMLSSNNPKEKMFLYYLRNNLVLENLDDIDKHSQINKYTLDMQLDKKEEEREGFKGQCLILKKQRKEKFDKIFE